MTTQSKDELPLNELSFAEQQEITAKLEGYRSNPSNSNKYRYDLFAYIDGILDRRINAVLDELLEKAVFVDELDNKILYAIPVDTINAMKRGLK